MILILLRILVTVNRPGGLPIVGGSWEVLSPSARVH